MHPDRSGNLKGAALMSAAAVLFAAEVLMIRWMTARGIPVEVQLFARALGQLLWVTPRIATSGLAVFRTKRLPMHLLRGMSSLVCWGLYYYSFTRLDMATGTVLSFTNVMFTTLLAAPILGERVDRWRWFGTIAGLLGVAVMLRPGAEVDALGAAAAIAAAVAWCGITLSSRSLTRTDSTLTVLAWVGVFTSLGVLPLAVLAWVPIGLFELGLLLVVATVMPGIIFLVTEALRHGEASAIAPFQYLRLVVVTAAGWILFNEVPDLFGWIGAAIILSGALVITVAEARRR
ncbi:DMT family transporter [Falsiroseomonas sp.]|uniref:DMT family transporter n=1 Tax=Falsiroseomonas sp. TaxID=2870721 RepID=UPI00271FC416|nr:DMT family transporter [Falsiroseomonas sp.]MDO9502070.1 DMT family transporter [Falsiroseomonas sp.]